MQKYIHLMPRSPRSQPIIASTQSPKSHQLGRPKPIIYIRRGWSSGKGPLWGPVNWRNKLPAHKVQWWTGTAYPRHRVTEVFQFKREETWKQKKRHSSQVISKYSWTNSTSFQGLGIILWTCGSVPWAVFLLAGHSQGPGVSLFYVIGIYFIRQVSFPDLGEIIPSLFLAFASMAERTDLKLSSVTEGICGAHAASKSLFEWLYTLTFWFFGGIAPLAFPVEHVFLTANLNFSIFWNPDHLRVFKTVKPWFFICVIVLFSISLFPLTFYFSLQLQGSLRN